METSVSDFVWTEAAELVAAATGFDGWPEVVR